MLILTQGYKFKLLPIFREILIKKQSKLIIWKILEDEEWFKSNLGNQDKFSRLEEFKNKRHRLQYLCAQTLLDSQGLAGRIVKSDRGKPFVKDSENLFVSISHDSDFVVLMLSDTLCGVDIQTINQKVMRIKNKFTDELDCFSKSTNDKELTTLWSLKEAVYKVNGIPEIFFKEHMRISQTNKNSFKSEILKEGYEQNLRLETYEFDQKILAFTL